MEEEDEETKIEKNNYKHACDQLQEHVVDGDKLKKQNEILREEMVDLASKNRVLMMDNKKKPKNKIDKNKELGYLKRIKNLESLNQQLNNENMRMMFELKETNHLGNKKKPHYQYEQNHNGP